MINPFNVRGFLFNCIYWYMEKGIEKLLRKLLIKKYPIILDVDVIEEGKFNPNIKTCYGVFLIVHIDDSSDFFVGESKPIRDYINQIAKYYLDVRICGVYKETVDDKEWEEMKSRKKD